MSQSSKRRRQKRESQFARNLAAIKREFQLLLGTLDPISAYNYLHHQGLVSQAEKEDLDRDITKCDTEQTDGGSSRPPPQKRSVSVYMKSQRSSGWELLKSQSAKPSSKAEEVACQKLIEIVDRKEDQNELNAIVVALTTFQKLHKEVRQRAATVGSDAEVKHKDGTLTAGEPISNLSEPWTSREGHKGTTSEENLMSAFEQGALSPEELIELLKETKDDCVAAELTNFEGKTLLHLACCMQPVEIVRELVSVYHCNPNAQDNDGNTPLHEASRCRKPVVVKYLVDLQSCDPNILNNSKETPLHLALRKEHWRLSKVILKSGKVDRTLKNARGQSLDELIERHPQSQERVKLKKYLSRRVSVASNKSASDFEDSLQTTQSPSRTGSKEGGRVRKSSSAGGVDTPDKGPEGTQTTEESVPKRKGILRSFDPSSIITTSQVEINIDSIQEESDLASTMTSSVKSEGNSDDVKKVHNNICLEICLIASKLGFFAFAMLLCVALLVFFIYYILS